MDGFTDDCDFQIGSRSDLKIENTGPIRRRLRTKKGGAREKRREKNFDYDNTRSPFSAVSPRRGPRDPPSPIPPPVPCIRPRRPPCRSSCPLVCACLTFLQTPKARCHTTLLRRSPRYNGRKIQWMDKAREREREGKNGKESRREPRTFLSFEAAERNARSKIDTRLPPYSVRSFVRSR